MSARAADIRRRRARGRPDAVGTGRRARDAGAHPEQLGWHAARWRGSGRVNPGRRWPVAAVRAGLGGRRELSQCGQGTTGAVRPRGGYLLPRPSPGGHTSASYIWRTSTASAGHNQRMGEDIVVPALTGLAGAVLALAGAYVQAKGARAQAEATTSSTSLQAEAAHLQWLRSSCQNAYTALVTEALEFEALASAYPPSQVLPTLAAHWPRPQPGRRVVPIRRIMRFMLFSRRLKRRTRRETLAWFAEVKATNRRIVHACAVIEMYGPDDVVQQASRVAASCYMLTAWCSWLFTIDEAAASGLPGGPVLPHAAVQAVQAVQAQRQAFARLVHPYL